MKEAIFLGKSLETLRRFPAAAMSQMGFQIHRLQRGEDPTDFKPVKEVGAGVFEIRISEDNSWFRAFYVTRFKDAIYILHAFEKKQNKTSLRDLRTGKKIYKELAQQKQRQAKE